MKWISFALIFFFILVISFNRFLINLLYSWFVGKWRTWILPIIWCCFKLLRRCFDKWIHRKFVIIFSCWFRACKSESQRFLEISLALTVSFRLLLDGWKQPFIIHFFMRLIVFVSKLAFFFLILSRIVFFVDLIVAIS